MASRLLRSFRFQVKLRESAGASGASAGASAGFSASASASVGFSAGVSAGIGIGAGAGGGALADGAFQECSGLEVELDVQEYLEGGRNDGVVRQVGRAKYQPLVLKRGMLWSDGGTVDRALWTWLQGIASGERPVRRYDGIVEVLGDGDEVVATWVFDRGLPTRLRGPALDAKSGEIAIEELHIAHEGLRLVEG
ncbi:MAG TPA: phage tail protein [Thermoanaerobaculia bacterium]|nr:phage tail protein [Thermoanaerobaculia bacterium]